MKSETNYSLLVHHLIGCVFLYVLLVNNTLNSLFSFFFISAGALVMPRPSPNHQWSNNKSGLPVVDVVVDPHLTSHLRPHQRDGLLFLYECVMGLRYYGCSCNMSCQVLFKETCLNLTAVTIIGIPNGS